jgi:hypothetical protein
VHPIHVGWAEGKRAYLPWCPERRTILESRDVKFDGGDGMEERVLIKLDDGIRAHDEEDRHS